MIKINSYNDIQGWFDFEHFYTEVVKVLPNGSNILEVGTWLGKSTCFLAQQIYNSQKNIKVYAVDTFKGEDTCEFQTDKVKDNGGTIFNEFWKNVNDLGLQEIIYPVISESHNCVDKIHCKKFDFIFIDADHKYLPVKRDVESLFPYLKPRGIFAGHDYEKEVQQAVDEFLASKGMKANRAGMCWYVQK
jgi:predicted O-methyltransferase YrrM